MKVLGRALIKIDDAEHLVIALEPPARDGADEPGAPGY